MQMIPHKLSIFLLALTLAVPAYAVTGAPLNRAGLVKTFADEFDTLSLYEQTDFKIKPAKGGTWRTNYGNTWAPFNDIKNHSLIWNNEEQIYVDPLFPGTSSKPLGLNPFSIKNGILSITAARTTNPNLMGYKYTSGLLTTEPTFSQTYGVFEMRAKLPKGKGIWPAFWMTPIDKSWPPELDIMEQLGQEPTKYYTTIHTKETGVTSKTDIPVHNVADTSKDFHTYAVEWGPVETVFYFDDKEVARRPTPKDMNKPFFMMLNLAVGGGWPGSPNADTKFPVAYEVDYVRAWKRTTVTNPSGTPAPAPSPAPAPTTIPKPATPGMPTSSNPSGSTIKIIPSSELTREQRIERSQALRR